MICVCVCVCVCNVSMDWGLNNASNLLQMIGAVFGPTTHHQLLSQHLGHRGHHVGRRKDVFLYYGGE